MTSNEIELKKFYNDALYWHLIHSGYSKEQARSKANREMNN